MWEFVDRPWFKSYLSNRSQAVFINGVLSEHEQIKCGVSQRPGASVYNLRTSLDDIAIPRARTDYYRKSFAFTVAKIWNALPNNMKSELSFETFRNKLKSLDLSIDI